MSGDGEILTVRDLMARWGCGRNIVLEAIHAKRLPAFRVGTHKYRVRLEDVVRYELAERAA